MLLVRRKGTCITPLLNIHINDPFGANNFQVKPKLLNEKLSFKHLLPKLCSIVKRMG